MRGQVDEGGAVERAQHPLGGRVGGEHGVDAVHGGDGAGLARRRRAAPGPRRRGCAPGSAGRERAPSHSVAEGETVTGRPAHEGSSAHGTFCSDPVGHDDQRPAGELGHPVQQGGVRPGGAVAQQGRGGGVQRGGQVGSQQPGDGEGDPVEQVVGGPHRPDPVQPGPAAGQGDRDERAVGVDELEQAGVAQRGGERLDAGGRRHRIAGPAAVQRPRPDPPFQRGLPGQQRPHLVAPAGAAQLGDLQDGPAQGGDRLGGLPVVRRAAGALHEQPGRPAALGPFQHLARPPRAQRDAQPQLGQRGAVPGRVRPDVGGAEHGAVLVEQPQAGPDRGAGTARVARVGAGQRLGVPAARPQHGRAGCAACRAASRRCAAASA